MSTQLQIRAKRSASARAAWSRSPRATCVGPCPANGSMPTPRSPAAKSSSAVCGLSTANTVRGSRSSIYLYCCFAVMNATRKPGPAPERELHVAFLFSLAVCTHGRIHAEPAGQAVVVARAVTSTSCSSQNLRCVLLNFCTGRRCRRRQSSSGSPPSAAYIDERGGVGIRLKPAADDCGSYTYGPTSSGLSGNCC